MSAGKLSGRKVLTEQELTRHLNSLLEGDTILARNTPDLDLGVALDGNTDSFVVKQPGVEASQGFDVINLNLLSNVDNLVLLAGGLWEVDPSERSLRLVVREVHNTLEAHDSGVNRAVSVDLGVNLHGQALALSAGDSDLVKSELGLVELLLSQLGHSNQQAGKGSESCSKATRA